MRRACYVLSFYFLALTAMACGDESPDATLLSGISYYQMDVQGDCQNHNHESTDFCSPFCVCHCCHTHFVVNHSFLESIIGINTLDQLTAYSQNIGKDIPNKLFHPPQV